jgi:RimJ/RimL family protein N-acetyltransferase
MRDVIEIETKRLKLRGVRMSDAQRIAQFCGDPAVGRNLAMTPLPYLDVAAEGWVLIARARQGRHFVFAADLPGEGLIGMIGAHPQADGRFEVGYWFGRPYWGRGFGTEAVHAFTAQARALGPLEAGHFVDNPASGRVLEKAGFAYTGEVKSTYSLGRGESVACKRMALMPANTDGRRAASFEVIH